LSTFRIHTDEEIANLKQDIDECYSRINKFHAEVFDQLTYLKQRVNTSRSEIGHINEKNMSKLVEISNIQSVIITELNWKITHLSDITEYFDAKFQILERRAKLKEKDENYQEQLQSLKEQIKIMKIMMYAVLGIFAAIKLLIICKWCCCIRSTKISMQNLEEIEMTPKKSNTKPNIYENAKKSEESVVYDNIGYDTNKSAKIGNRKSSNQFQNISVGTIPKTTNNLNKIKGDNYSVYTDEFDNNAGHDESQIYDTCELDDSIKNTLSKQKGKEDSNNFNFPPPPNDFLNMNKNLVEEDYYDEFNYGYADDPENLYDSVNRESIGVYEN